ncbi:MAG: hypothetical protein M0R03_15650 [Novosphingobium sp.]|nr:hypothetical protein [Novosphingobium sp.]
MAQGDKISGGNKGVLKQFVIDQLEDTMIKGLGITHIRIDYDTYTEAWDIEYFGQVKRTVGGTNGRT